MTKTGEILAAAHARADSVSSADQAELGRALLFCGASILGQAEGADRLAEALISMARSAIAAMDEGERCG